MITVCLKTDTHTEREREREREREAELYQEPTGTAVISLPFNVSE
jgi:hypothetical protein